MKKLPLVILYSLLNALSFASPGDTLNLELCLKKAAENRRSARQNANNEHIYDNAVKNLNTNWLPSVGVNAQAVYNSEAIDFSDAVQNLPFAIPSVPLDQYKLWADINQQIYDGGANKALKEMEKYGYESGVAQSDAEVLALQMQVNQVYFSLLQVRNSREILVVSVKELATHKAMVKAGVEHGILLKDNLLAMEAEEIALQQKVTETDLTNKRLIKVLGILLDTVLNPATALTEPYDPVVDESGRRPELLLFDVQIKTLDAGKNLISSAALPRVFAFMQLAYGRPGYNMLNTDFHTFYSVGAGLKWNFLNYHENKRRKQIIGFQQDNIEIKRENFDRQLNIQLQAELTNLALYDSLMMHDEKILQIRKEIAASGLSRLRNGTTTAADYLRDMNAEIVAKLQLQSHKLLKKQALYNYQQLQGKL